MMELRPQLIYWQFDNGGQNGFADVVLPAEFPHVKPRFWNDPWADRIGLASLSTADREKHFARFVPLSGAQPKPLAMRYHGHQFRHYNEDLGDGRGFLFAQAQDPVDLRLLDFGTKGSGQTPYSRAGDGRLTLKGAFREALATEMLESLGVNTSKTFSFFETDERLQRHGFRTGIFGLELLSAWRICERAIVFDSWLPIRCKTTFRGLILTTEFFFFAKFLSARLV